MLMPSSRCGAHAGTLPGVAWEWKRTYGSRMSIVAKAMENTPYPTAPPPDSTNWADAIQCRLIHNAHWINLRADFIVRPW